MESSGSTHPTPQLGLPALLALFLVPGALMTAAFVIAAPLLESAGFPPIAALLLAILVVLLPIELGILVWAGRGSDARIRSVVPYRRPVPLRDWLWLVPALVIVAFIGFGVSMAFEPAVIASVFGWLPDWFVRPIDIDSPTLLYAAKCTTCETPRLLQTSTTRSLSRMSPTMRSAPRSAFG